MLFQSIHPQTGKVIAEYPLMDAQTINNKLQAGETAFKSWKTVSFEERARLLQNVAEILRRDKEKFAKLISNEMGKLPNEAIAEVEKSAWVCDFYATHSAEFLKDEVIESNAQKSYVSYVPIGGVLAIMPWNFPFWQVFRFSAPSLMAGNVVFLKHAPNVCGCALLIEEVFREAGLPESTFQTLIIDIDAVEQVVENELIQGVALTGSDRAGSAVGALAGKHIKKSILELGGSDPFIVLGDADIEKASQMAVASRMGNAGQTCISAKRFLIQEEVIDDFVQAVNNKLADLNIACMARQDLTDNLERQFNDAIAQGAKVLAGGKRDGNYFEPTILTGVTPEMTVFNEETFGPLMCITSVKDEKEAIKLANQTVYGLGCSVWTEDLSKATAIAEQITTGTVSINNMVKSDPRLPFGGVKRSGYGRELSSHGIREFVNIKTIMIG